MISTRIGNVIVTTIESVVFKILKTKDIRNVCSLVVSVLYKQD